MILSRHGGAWRRPFLATMALGLLVAAGLWDDEPWLPLAVVVTAALGFGVLFWLFPGGLGFALGAGMGFATYAALFAGVACSAFPGAS